VSGPVSVAGGATRIGFEAGERLPSWSIAEIQIEYSVVGYSPVRVAVVTAPTRIPGPTTSL
jgi:hypothetical protein